MTDPNQKILLNNQQMEDFLNHGFVRLDDVIPHDLCEAAKALFDTDNIETLGKQGCNVMERYPEGSPVYRLLRVPKVLGMIESLVGPNPRFDHHAIHKKPPHSGFAQNLHQDAVIDIRKDAFDIQLSFFIHDTPVEMGGTRFLPGSHYRRVHQGHVGRYQNIIGMYQVICKAGTVVAWHHNLWHGAQPNHTDQMRYMFKMRLNPQVKQQLLWDHGSSDPKSLQDVQLKGQPWYGQDDRIELCNRIRMWRFLTKNPTYDWDDYYTRIENQPV